MRSEATFRDRIEGGRRLAEKLLKYEGRPEVLVMGLPRGGVPVAAQVAKRLKAPLEVFVVRKLGLPDEPELAMGALASGGVRVLNKVVVEARGISQETIDAVAERESQELERRERVYRGERPTPELNGRIVILVDDGVATGSTARAGIKALRQMGVSWIVLATPTIARDTVAPMGEVADEVAYVIAPEDFLGVGQWYENFAQTTDEEVRRLLGESERC